MPPSFFLQVKVVLRVNPAPSRGPGQPPALRVDSSKKRVTVIEPISKSQLHYSTMTLDRDGKKLMKTFNLDAAYPPESSQVWHPHLSPQPESKTVSSVSLHYISTYFDIEM